MLTHRTVFHLLAQHSSITCAFSDRDGDGGVVGDRDAAGRALARVVERGVVVGERVAQ